MILGNIFVMFKFCCNFTAKLDFFKPSIFVCEYVDVSITHTLSSFFFLLFFSLNPSGNILSFCYIGFGHFLRDFSLDILCFCLFFYCEWNLWVTPSFLLLLIPHTNLLASAVGSLCIWMQSEPMPASLKSPQANSFSLGHRLVSTYFQGPLPTHLPEVAFFRPLKSYQSILQSLSVMLYSTKIWSRFPKAKCLVPSSSGYFSSFFSLSPLPPSVCPALGSSLAGFISSLHQFHLLREVILGSLDHAELLSPPVLAFLISLQKRISLLPSFTASLTAGSPAYLCLLFVLTSSIEE